MSCLKRFSRLSCNKSSFRCLSVRAAASQLHVETPLIFSEPLSKRLGADVHLKLDLLQPSGSFKLRGIGETVRAAVKAGATRIVSSSGGNAGLAAAFSARACGVPCTVVLPTTTSSTVADRLRGYGAEVVVHGSVWDEADKQARLIVEEQKGGYVHPFDQEATWEGHSTVVDEIQKQLHGVVPDAIVTCVGGGGLLMGILMGVERASWNSTRVIAGETHGANCLAESLKAGELVTLPAITSIAKSLGALRPSQAVFERCQKWGPRFQSFVCSDAEVLEACYFLASEHRLLVEPASGAALAAVVSQSKTLEGCRNVVVEVCGGSAVDIAQMSSWGKEFSITN
eukprot:TRINITY_DN12975_c0_g3_i1.p1 TRINITY_DN12975_c0_g3~~TRINITY_DN12975_c0_g3_i1.p1  ORF type:complete len:341 (-),score=71.01 TRINITY_DN12975_c0_g3_i1:47-1069(-)